MKIMLQNNRIWDKSALIEEALQHSTFMSFRTKARGAYNAAVKSGLYKEITSHMRKAPITRKASKWDETAVQKEALKYKSRVEFQENARGAYKAARRMGIVNSVTSHMTRRGVIWNPQTIEAEALLYESRLAFHLGSQGACQAARKLGIFDEVCRHMDSIRICDDDVFYIWKALDLGDDVYKIGVTSERLGCKRISEAAKSFKTRFSIVCFQKTSFSAKSVEKAFLEHFCRKADVPNYLTGYSEFRKLTVSEVSSILRVLEDFK